MRFSRSLQLLSALLAGGAGLLAQERRVEQARQFQLQANAVHEEHAQTSTTLDAGTFGGDDQSFGTQQFLKRPERVQPFRVFSEISGFVTNNVALTRRDQIDDAFLVATFGMEYRRALTSHLQWETTIRSGLFRYNRVSALDFISIDAGTGLTLNVPELWDLNFFGRYNFTDLVNDRNGDEFFQNHSLTLGAQKTVALSRAHYLYAGLSAQFGLADPSTEQRNEYSAFAGYHLQATRRWEAELYYRYAFYDYTDRSRSDHNNGLTISTRYTIADWVSVFGSAYVGFNRSSIPVFDYDVANLGVGLGLSVRF